MSTDHESLCGREAETLALRKALEEASAGRGRLAVIQGEAGIGKTALATILGVEAGARGARVAWGKAWEFGEAPPYFPLWACLRQIGLADESWRSSDETAAFALWEHVLEALARESRLRPTVWILDDLHAADLLSLDLLAFLAQPLAGVAALIVVTARARDSRLTPRAAQRLQRMARAGLQLELGPLGAADVAELAARHAGQRLSARIARELLIRTEGNPLFVVECARALRDAHVGERPRRVLPESVRHAIVERLDGVDPEARALLAAGAVLGREFSVSLAAQLLTVDVASLLDSLESAQQSGLLVAAGLGRFAFSHGIVHEVVEATLGARQRAEFHLRAERALAELSDGQEIAPERIVERARHALEGMLTGAGPHAVELVESAARMLEAQGALDRAYALLFRLSELRQNGVLPPSSDTGALLHLGELAFEAGCALQGRAICAQLMARARASADSVLLARAALVLGRELQPAVTDRGLSTALEEALTGLGTDSGALGCRVLARLAAALQPAADPRIPMDLARAAILKAHQIGDPRVLTDVLVWAGSALVGYAPQEERIAAARELLERATDLRDQAKVLRARARLAMEYVEQGEFAAFDIEVARMLELSTELGHPRQRFGPLLFASMRACLHGSFAESERYVVEAGAIAELIDDPALSLSLPAHRGQRAFLRHSDEELHDLLEVDVHEHGSAEPSLIPGIRRAASFARREDVERTALELCRLEPRVARLESEAPFSASLAEAYALAGSEVQRRRLRLALEPLREREIASGHVPMTYEGPVLRLLALLDAALGDSVAAETQFRAALAKARQRGHAPWIAQLAYELARFLVRSGRLHHALPFAWEAWRFAKQLGMPGLAGRAWALVPSSAGSDAAAKGSPPATVPGLECDKEGDVWRLEHRGKTVRVRDSRGMQLLARLIERPRDELHVLTLASDGMASENPSCGWGPLLDDRARTEYCARLAEIERELTVAEADADLGRLERLRSERESFRAGLASAFGLRGKARPAGSATERARINVQRSIKTALAHIASLDQELGEYLAQAIRTGTYCCFRP